MALCNLVFATLRRLKQMINLMPEFIAFSFKFGYTT